MAHADEDGWVLLTKKQATVMPTTPPSTPLVVLARLAAKCESLQVTNGLPAVLPCRLVAVITAVARVAQCGHQTWS